MGMLPNYLQPRAHKTRRIQLPLDTTRASLPELKAHHARRLTSAVDNSPVCGCLSSLSIPHVQRADFKSAIAEFSGLRQAAACVEYNNVYNHVAIVVPHAFSNMSDSEASTEVLDAMPRRQIINSDLIEECGYFGWLA